MMFDSKDTIENKSCVLGIENKNKDLSFLAVGGLKTRIAFL